MKNEGFTLVELLAVILILAFIAIIAVPIVLNIITEAKIKSLKISTSEYIRAVNTSLINEEVFNNVSDGLYTITDDGKKIVLGDKEIFISFDGRGLKSGLLLIENSKVTRVLKGLIDDYYARVTDEDITILKNLNESTLVNGQTFNSRIKELVEDTIPEGNNKTLLDAEDTIVKKIIFLQDSVLPIGYTKETLQQLKSTDLSSTTDGSIKGYYDSEKGTIYVYSDGYINCPTNLSNMFQNFQGVEEIELNLIDTSATTNMGAMFMDCILLKKIAFIGLDTSKVTTMGNQYGGGMFQGCTNLMSIEFGENFKTSKVANMGKMFQGCSNLQEIIGLEEFNTSKVKYMNNMFNGCSSLEYLDLSNWDTSEVANIYSMFSGCTNLKRIDFNENINTSKVTNMSAMFRNCSSLTTLDLSKFDTSQVTDMARMFDGCSSLEYLNLSNWDTGLVSVMADNNGGMFTNCTNLKEIKGIENFNTINVKNMTGMFAGCSSLISLDLSKWDTRNVTDVVGWFGGMFSNCINLKELKFGENFTLENVTSFKYSSNSVSLFYGCSSLTELDLTSFDTHKVTSYNGTFSGCTNLKVVKVTTGKWTLDVDLLKGTKAEEYTYFDI